MTFHIFHVQVLNAAINFPSFLFKLLSLISSFFPPLFESMVLERKYTKMRCDNFVGTVWLNHKAGFSSIKAFQLQINHFDVAICNQTKHLRFHDVAVVASEKYLTNDVFTTTQKTSCFWKAPCDCSTRAT